MVFVTCPKLTEEEKVGVRCARWTLRGPGMRRLAQGVGPGTPGTLAGLWGPGFCGGAGNRLSGGAVVVLPRDEDHRPGGGGPPWWLTLTVVPQLRLSL